jgi:hypothetical protein
MACFAKLTRCRYHRGFRRCTPGYGVRPSSQPSPRIWPLYLLRRVSALLGIRHIEGYYHWSEFVKANTPDPHLEKLDLEDSVCLVQD